MLNKLKQIPFCVFALVFAFYKNVIKESDAFMQYYYAVGAFCIFCIFYLTGILFAVIYPYDVQVTTLRLSLITLLILPIIVFLKNNRWEYEQRLKDNPIKSFDPTVIVFSIIYIFLSLPFVLTILVVTKK